MALSSTIAYCENQDVFDIYPRIDKFDLKRKLNSAGVKSGSNYYYYNSGRVDRLFKNGEDLGAMVEDLGQLDRPDEWFYNIYDDLLIINESSQLGGTNPNLDVLEAGDVWEDIIERFRIKASRLIESVLGKSISREILKDREGNYPPSINHITALKTAILLIMAHDTNHPDLIPLNVEYDGIIGKILSGRIVMTGHRSENDSKGTIREIAVDSGSGLRPVEIKGDYSGLQYELLKLIIDSADDTKIGSATYSVYNKNSTRLKTNQIVASEIINGDYQKTGIDDLYIRWGCGDVATDVVKQDDEYEIELWGDGLHPTITQIKSTKLSRETLWL